MTSGAPFNSKNARVNGLSDAGNKGDERNLDDKALGVVAHSNKWRPKLIESS
jgi:hypothetical protein